MENQPTDVFKHIQADHESLRGVLNSLASPEVEVGRKRAIFRRMLPLFRSRTYGLEHSVITEGLKHEQARPAVIRCLEEHEIAEIGIRRVSLAQADEVWVARLAVFCQLINEHINRTEKAFELLRGLFSKEKVEELGMKYLDTRNKYQLSPISEGPVRPDLVYDQAGKIGYLVAWLLGVPAWILLLVFLIRG